MQFEFAAPGRVLFGEGRLKEVPALVRSFSDRVLLVTGKSRERARLLQELLQAHGIEVALFPVGGEPTLGTVAEGVRMAAEGRFGAVVGFGGGSAMDAAKAVAALAANPGDILDYLEVIGTGRPITRAPLPCVVLPTTAGSGAEATRNAVLTSPEHRVKVSLRSPLMLPRVAVVDPELTHSLPPSLTAATGLDALTQLLEAFLCNSPNPMTDALCREGIVKAAGALRRVYRDGLDREARVHMSLAALLGGIVLANARLGAVHGLAGPLGGMFPAPHGMICARLLPVVLAANARALQARAPASPILARFREVAAMVTGRAEAGIQEGITWLEALCEDLAVPPLSRLGVDAAELPAVAAQALKASSMKGNPVELTREELLAILQEAL